MNDATSIRRSVRDLYMSHPFPQLTAEQRRRHLVFDLCKYKFLGLDRAMSGARVLDVGCGTGRHMLLMKQLGVRLSVGLDQSSASLAIAKQAAAEEGFPAFLPVIGDLFRLPFSDESFDVVVSWGVLHHTPDPPRGLAEMARVCRRGGFVGIFVYNRFNHWRFNRQKAKVDRLAGADVEERFRVAHRLYGTKPVERMTTVEKVVFYDRYCHPYRSDHTFGEVLSWFDRLGLEYWGSSRPVRFTDFVRYLQHLARLVSEWPDDAPRDGLARRAVQAARLAARLPSLGEPAVPFRRPGVFHRFVWQVYLAGQGWSGRQSHSTSFSARKR